MQRFKNILLLWDGKASTDPVLGRAAALAKRNHARLALVDVVAELSDAQRLITTGQGRLDLQELVVKERSDQLKQAAGSVRNGIRIKTDVLAGTPFIQGIRRVIRENHDLVMIGAGGAEPLLGTTAMQLMRKCPCPVWVMKRTRRKTYARVLAAVDTDPYDYPDMKNNMALNARIMELASSLARLERSELHVVHAWDVTFAQLLRRHSGMSKAERDRWVEGVRILHEQSLTALLERYVQEGFDRNAHLLRGDPGTLIPRLATRLKVDMIVMGTVCRTGLAGFFLGNTAEDVLRKMNCSVIAVKPEGFVSPVTLD